jgi:hypothetical protein
VGSLLKPLLRKVTPLVGLRMLCDQSRTGKVFRMLCSSGNSTIVWCILETFVNPKDYRSIMATKCGITTCQCLLHKLKVDGYI